MSWVYLDDGFADHPKILAAGPMAGWLQVKALCWSLRHLTDGFIPEHVIPTLVVGLDPSVDWPAAMVLHRLWRRNARRRGFFVHDFSKYQKTKAEVEQLREAKQRAGKIGASRRWGLQPIARAMAPADQVLSPKKCPLPYPTLPERENQEEEGGGNAHGLRMPPPVVAPPPPPPPADRVLTPIQNGHGPPTAIPYEIPASVQAALARAPTFGGDPQCRSPGYWRAVARAYPFVDLAGELLKAEIYLAAGGNGRGPPSEPAQFLRNWYRTARPAEDTEP